MTYSALLLGSIGVLVETSDLQRRAFNTAFEENELIWHWDDATYRALLKVPGGKARLSHFASQQGVDVDVDALYEAKLNAFETVLSNGITLRPGIADLISEAQRLGIKLGFVTSTDPRQVAAVLKGLQSQVDPSVFDFIGDRTIAARTKPAPDIYNEALRQLDVAPDAALAIEDTPESAQAAVSAGIQTLAYPGTFAAGRSFAPQVAVTDTVHVSLLRGRAAAA